jgi:hypothetical protein
MEEMICPLITRMNADWEPRQPSNRILQEAAEVAEGLETASETTDFTD